MEKMAIVISFILTLSCSKGTTESSLSYERKMNSSEYLSLNKFNSCEDLTSNLREQLIEEMKEGFAYQRQRFMDFGSSPEILVENSVGDAMEPAHSDTNVQVAGVDEGDLVKSNGNYLFSIGKNKVFITKTWPAEELSIASTISFDHEPSQLILYAEDRLIVVENILDAFVSSYESPAGYESSSQNLYVFDISDITKPKELKKWQLSGSGFSLRRVAEKLIFIQNNWPEYPPGLKYWIEEEGNLESFDRKIAEAIEKNTETLASWSFEDFFSLSSDETLLKDDCTKILIPEKTQALTMSKINTINLEELSLNQSALMLSSENLYVSNEALYLSKSYYGKWDEADTSSNKTIIHRFSLDANLNTHASGMIDGTILNQFSMDEHEDVFRIATTITSIESSAETVSVSSENRVFCLKKEASKLAVIGQTQNLVENESIYAVRFHNDKAYVVTFRQIDPLFTLDLSNPKEPKVVGELKIPGFSTYIHILDENHLLALGQDGDFEGNVFGSKLSVFDVSDFKSPKEKFSYVFKSGFANPDYHAFNYYQGKLAISFREYEGAYRSLLYVFDISLDQGISELGSLRASEQRRITRSVFIEDYVYAIGKNELIVARAEEGLEEIGRMNLD